MSRRKRWTLVVSGLVVLVAAVYVVLNSGDGMEVELGQATRGDLQVTITEEGRTRALRTHVVAAPVAGRLLRITLEEGDDVVQGAVLARIDQTPEGPRDQGIAAAQVEAARANRDLAQAELQRAQAAEEQTRREVVRRQSLAADSILSAEEGEQAHLAATSARQRVRAAESAVEAAEAELVARQTLLYGTDGAAPSTLPVRAPNAGRVLRVFEKSERVVQPGTPLLQLAGSNGMEVVVDVLSEDAVKIAPGNPVVFTQWGGDTRLEGRVRRIEPAAFTKVSALGVEEQRVNVIADLDNPPSNLGEGYRMEAEIVVWDSTGVLTVPTSALFQLDGAWQVFAVEDGRAARRAVGIGHRSARMAEVLSGLEEGDAVILFPSDLIEEGVRVADGG